MKVHIIEAELKCGLPQALANREMLGQEIVSLARTKGENVFFHEFKNDMLGGAPTIMLECSDAFLADVRALPSYRKDQDVWSGKDFETQRSAKLQHYYFSGGAAARKGPDCKIIPPPRPGR
jgi:hypothetical protein